MKTLSKVRFALWVVAGFMTVVLAVLVWRVMAGGPPLETGLALGRPMAEGADWRLTDEGGRPHRR
jgi:hypothetical protein